MKRAAWALAVCTMTTASTAQSRERLSLREVARGVAVEAGGEIVLRGSVRSSHDGAVIDAMTTRPGASGVEGDGEAVPGGLYDVEGGGWRMVSRDPRAHSYRLAATGSEGVACREAQVRSPCLPLRLLPLAQTRLLAVSEFAGTLSGELTLEVLDPDSAPREVPPWMQRYGGALGAALVAAALSGAGAWAMRKRAATPEAMLRRTAASVRAKLGAGDPVHRQLAPSVDALVEHAMELMALRERLEKRVAATDRGALTRRRDELAAKEREGVSEAAKARALVDEQIERADRWREESERAGARVAEVHEYLRALSQRLDESIGATATVQEESTREALRGLELDVQSALEGAREAERVVG